MEFTAAMLAAVVAAILVGAVLQRLSGSGMGLVLAPTLTLIMGAAHGVLLANATTTVSGLLLTLTLRRDVDWRRAGIICACVVPGALVGAVVVREVSAAWLQVVVGVAVLGAIGFTVGADRLGRLPHVTSAWPTPVAGVIGGDLIRIGGVLRDAVGGHLDPAPLVGAGGNGPGIGDALGAHLPEHQRCDDQDRDHEQRDAALEEALLPLVGLGVLLGDPASLSPEIVLVVGGGHGSSSA